MNRALEFFSVINCSDGATVPKGLMTYGTTQRRSEFDMPATVSKRPAKRSHRPAKRFVSLGGQKNGLEGSQRVRKGQEVS